MKKLFEIADKYISSSSWKDIALIKFCLCAIGVLIGVSIAPKHKKTVAISAVAVFIITYIPLMAKFFKVALSGNSSCENGEE